MFFLFPTKKMKKLPDMIRAHIDAADQDRFRDAGHLLHPFRPALATERCFCHLPTKGIESPARNKNP